MQRGSRLFDKLINDEIEKKQQPSKRGRNENLIAERNECLIYRYYYYSKIHRLRYADMIEKMQKEFYLSERTVADIIQVNSELVSRIFSGKPEVKTLIIKYNYLNWTKKTT